MKHVTCTKCGPPITWCYRRGASYRLSTKSGQGLNLICCGDCMCVGSHAADWDIVWAWWVYDLPSPVPTCLVWSLLLLLLCLVSFCALSSLFSYACEAFRNLASLLIPFSVPRRNSMFQFLPEPRMCWWWKCVLHSNRIWCCVCSVSEQWHFWFSLSMNQW